MSILNVEHLSHGFGDRAIFQDVSFRLLKGEHIGLVGANGEGKSTFFKIVTDRMRTEPHIPEVRSWIRRICWDTAKMPCSFITLRQAEKTSGPGLQENSSTLPNGYTIRQTVEKHWCGMIVF